MNAQHLGHYFAVPPLWLAALLPAIVALAAWRLRWLTRNGAISTLVVGLVIFWLGGGKATLPLLTFFVTSSLLSKLARSRSLQEKKQEKQQEKQDNIKKQKQKKQDKIENQDKIESQDSIEAKGSTRDAGQVWANGGAAVAIVLLHRALVLTGFPPYRLEALPILFLVAFATVNADTWATELGRLAGQTPRSLRDGKPVPAGTSGAITVVGTLAALAGALIVPLAVYFVWPLNPAQLVCVVWAGFLGCLIDSLLGASFQAQYLDPETGLITERTQIHGRPTRKIRGLPWMNNDLVNFLASVGGVLCGYYLLHYAHLA